MNHDREKRRGEPRTPMISNARLLGLSTPTSFFPKSMSKPKAIAMETYMGN